MKKWLKTDRAAAGDEFSRILTAIYDFSGRGAAVDLGCGEAHVTQHWPMCCLIDLVKREAVARPIEQVDIRAVPTWFFSENRKVNLAVMLDSLEHLTKEDGEKLLTGMEPIAKAILVFAPIGDYKVNAEAKDPDTHKSGWTPAEMAAKGWTVWEWPAWHPFVGAFWAWKWTRGDAPSAEEVAAKAGVIR